jgi:hypothetical protein
MTKEKFREESGFEISDQTHHFFSVLRWLCQMATILNSNVEV